MYIIKYISVGLYNVLLTKYLSNFTNQQIDTKIFAVNSIITSISSAIYGVFASRLVDEFNTGISMIIFGIVSLIMIILTLLYIKNKVGLDPKEYSNYELEYEMKV